MYVLEYCLLHQETDDNASKKIEKKIEMEMIIKKKEKKKQEAKDDIVNFLRSPFCWDFAFC